MNGEPAIPLKNVPTWQPYQIQSKRPVLCMTISIRRQQIKSTSSPTEITSVQQCDSDLQSEHDSGIK